MSLVLNDAASAIVTWTGLFLTLPMEGMVIDPVIDVTMIFRFSLFVDSHKKHVNLSILEHNVAGIPVPGIKFCTKEWRNFFPHKLLPNSKLQRIYDCLKSSQCAHCVICRHIRIRRIVGLQ